MHDLHHLNPTFALVCLLAAAGCTSTEKSMPRLGRLDGYPVPAELLAQPLWQQPDRGGAFDGRELDEGMVQTVSHSQAVHAAQLLEKVSAVSISRSMARQLVGEDHLLSGAVTRRAILAKKKRISELKSLGESFPESRPRFNEEIAERQDEIQRLKQERWRLKPYLCRGVAFKGCGTGSYNGSFDNGKLWISFGALGDGGFTEYNLPVVVYLPSPPTEVSLSTSLAR